MPPLLAREAVGRAGQLVYEETMTALRKSDLIELEDYLASIGFRCAVGDIYAGIELPGEKPRPIPRG